MGLGEKLTIWKIIVIFLFTVDVVESVVMTDSSNSISEATTQLMKSTESNSQFSHQPPTQLQSCAGRLNKHGTKAAFSLPTQQTWVRISTLLKLPS